MWYLKVFCANFYFLREEGRKRGGEVGQSEGGVRSRYSKYINSNKSQISSPWDWWEIHMRVDASLIVDACPEPQSLLLWEPSLCTVGTLPYLCENCSYYKGHFTVSDCECLSDSGQCQRAI